MIPDFKHSTELFAYINNVELPKVPSVKELLKNYDTPAISIQSLIEKIKIKDNILLLDGRSEKEFQETALPGAINFPVLTNEERHNVGLVYKSYSQQSAVWLAMQYADPKQEKLNSFLKENAIEKEIIVYCWRGGGRSGYLSKMITDAGYKPTIVSGGQKAYRKEVNEFFVEAFPYKLIEVSGLTGSGKTDFLNILKGNLPVIDLEKASHHYSSLFGAVPYELKGMPKITSQAAFENNVYSDIITNYTETLPYFIESESKRVGNYFIPGTLYEAMEKAPAILISSSLESRIKRIERDYFKADPRGIALMTNIMKSKEDFFKQQLSKAVYSKTIEMLKNEDTYRFTEIMITEYYDKRYKQKPKEYISQINMDDKPVIILNEAKRLAYL